mgnify:CR=1 FL=1
MARIKGGLNAKKKHNRTLKLAKGYRGARSKQYRVAKQSVMANQKHVGTTMNVSYYGSIGLEWGVCTWTPSQPDLYDIDFTEQQCDETYRRQLEDLAREHGAEYLHGILREVEPASAEAIHANNIKRVIRALEFYHLSGKKISEHNETELQNQSPYNFAYFVLTDERAKLYERIDRRVDAMIEAGLVEEVKKLKSMGCSREMVSIKGYERHY